MSEVTATDTPEHRGNNQPKSYPWVKGVEVYSGVPLVHLAAFKWFRCEPR